jgi:hypothetical protein
LIDWTSLFTLDTLLMSMDFTRVYIGGLA